MASLKEIKTRVQSVQSTQKITSAMKMVSSAKLRKAQRAVEGFYPYQQKISVILNHFIAGQSDVPVSVYSLNRQPEKVAIVVFASNSSLCGSYNSNVVKKLLQTFSEYKVGKKENILVYPIGNKTVKAIVSQGYNPETAYEQLADHPDYKEISDLVDKLILKFREKELDRVVIIYHHFKSTGSQVLMSETVLPFTMPDSKKKKVAYDMVLEPDTETIMEQLIPQVIKVKLYSALLDSIASEHAARTMAMQAATENANELLQDLSLQYNKSRQQAITNELLDIVGGSFE